MVTGIVLLFHIQHSPFFVDDLLLAGPHAKRELNAPGCPFLLPGLELAGLTYIYSVTACIPCTSFSYLLWSICHSRLEMCPRLVSKR
jgi:hypothetical protein